MAILYSTWLYLLYYAILGYIKLYLALKSYIKLKLAKVSYLGLTWLIKL
jgi:hypothetical protein